MAVSEHPCTDAWHSHLQLTAAEQRRDGGDDPVLQLRVRADGRRQAAALEADGAGQRGAAGASVDLEGAEAAAVLRRGAAIATAGTR